MPHVPEIAYELIELYKPQEMDAHRARHHALKMLDQEDSLVDNSEDLEGTIKEINKSMGTDEFKDKLKTPKSVKSD